MDRSLVGHRTNVLTASDNEVGVLSTGVRFAIIVQNLAILWPFVVNAKTNVQIRAFRFVIDHQNQPWGQPLPSSTSPAQQNLNWLRSSPHANDRRLKTFLTIQYIYSAHPPLAPQTVEPLTHHSELTVCQPFRSCSNETTSSDTIPEPFTEFPASLRTPRHQLALPQRRVSSHFRVNSLTTLLKLNVDKEKRKRSEEEKVLPGLELGTRQPTQLLSDHM